MIENTRKQPLAPNKLLALQQKRQKRRRLHIFLWAAGIIALVAGVIDLSRLQSLAILRVSVQGNQVIDAGDISNSVEQDISGNYFFFFPKHNALIYPKNHIAKDLSARFPRISGLSIALVGMHELHVTITERDSMYLWCGMTVPETDSIDTHCYYVDGDGYIFSRAPYFSGAVYFKFFGGLADPSRADDPVGDRVLPDAEFRAVVQMKESLEAAHLAPHSYVTYGDGTRAFLLATVARDDIDKVIFSSKNDKSKVVSNLLAALNVEPLKTDFATEFDALQYIDLRSDNKVYYKFASLTANF